MTRTHSHLNTRNTGEQVNTHTGRTLLQRTERGSLLWFARLALVWAVGSAAAGFALALLAR